MNGWTFIVPLKRTADRKQRLPTLLPAQARIDLTQGWALDTLAAARAVGHVLLLSDEPLPVHGVDWRQDEGRGLNALTIADDRSFTFAFGTDSCARHRAAGAGAAIVRRPGLAFDVDTPEDWARFAAD